MSKGRLRIILPAVISADGRITKGDVAQPHEWSSPEDFTFFKELVACHTALIMGRKTYEAVQPVVTPDKLRLVLTSQPEHFRDQAVPGSLEFLQTEPQMVVQELEKRGYQEALLVGGGLVHAAFLQAGLVDELYLTVEPLLFGEGVPLLAGAVDISMKLLETTRLNEQGTLLLHYRVNR